LFSHDWQDEQREIDMKLDGERSNWSDSVFNDAILANPAIVPKNSTIISYNPRKLAYHCHINAHLLAEVGFQGLISHMKSGMELTF
jgi:hypothetical protein